MSHHDITNWHIVDKDGNELDITDVLLNSGITFVAAVKYDPGTLVRDALRQAIDDEPPN